MGVDDNGLAGRSRCTADALVQRNPCVRRGLAHIGPKRQFLSREQIDPHPVVVLAFVAQQSDDRGEQGSAVGRRQRKVSDGLDDFNGSHGSMVDGSQYTVDGGWGQRLGKEETGHGKRARMARGKG